MDIRAADKKFMETCRALLDVWTQELEAMADGGAAIAEVAQEEPESKPTAHGHAYVSSSAADDALRRLKHGNGRFASEACDHPHADRARRRETVENGQHPFATVVACSDSRVPVELLFDQGIGDIFVIRVAGNVCGPDELGSIEYALGHLQTPILVLLGHTHCGAVTAVATEGSLPGHLAGISEQIQPAVDRARSAHPGAEMDDLVTAAVHENVWDALERLLTCSETVRECVQAGTSRLVGAIYDLADGSVAWLGRHPKEDALLRRPMAPSGGAQGQVQSKGLSPEELKAGLSRIRTVHDLINVGGTARLALWKAQAMHGPAPIKAAAECLRRAAALADGLAASVRNSREGALVEEVCQTAAAYLDTVEKLLPPGS